MNEKKILGLDLGTNSIGWALVTSNFEKKEGEINAIGSRIIPMDQKQMSEFENGNTVSQTAQRTEYRGVRRLYQRDNLRRERLHRVLNVLNFLPEHYKNEIDFENKLGQFKREVKINYRKEGTGSYKFLFMDSYNEMLKDFRLKQPDLFFKKSNGEESKISYDWTLYYLRKKALTEKITKEELSWVLLNFNQKRGYYQLRGEEEEKKEGESKTFEVLKVKELVLSEQTIKGKEVKLYDVVFENGWIYSKPIAKTEDWIGKTREFIVTTKTLKSGEIKRTYKAVDSEKDWLAIKSKTEQDLERYIQNGEHKTVGTYIYDELLKNPDQKIRGSLIKTIERHYYKDELKAILNTQLKLHKELKNVELYSTCINELYKRNETHKNNIKSKGFDYLFLDDIIFYQRPLKSKKSLISGCQFEKHPLKDKEGKYLKNDDGDLIFKPLKAISKSHPLYQEFRLWQFLKNLKFFKKGGKEDEEVTTQWLTSEDDWVELFDFLSVKKDVSQDQMINFFVKNKIITKEEKGNYRWNYVEDKKYPCNEVKYQLINRLKKIKGLNVEVFLTPDIELKLWHIIYSVTDKVEFEKALENFALRNNLDKDSFVSSFSNYPPFKSDYGAFSEKAIKKMLPLMRRGKHFEESAILPATKTRIEQIMERVNDLNLSLTKDDFKKELLRLSDSDVPVRLIKSFIPFKGKNPLTGLNTYQVSYAVYNRHSEPGVIDKWRTPSDIDNYLTNVFKQHSLRNPIVEKIVTETLRVVRDVWRIKGRAEENFFDEIHVELGREMKNSADKRKQMTNRITENQNTNERLRALLKELKEDDKVEGVIRPHSPSQQELLKIFEEGVLQNPDVSYVKVNEDDITKIRKSNSPTKSDMIKYKLWLEQGYISPYTGKIIALSQLFTTQYEIEHIIPQSRYFDNSLSNKVICESEVNRLKGNKTGVEFIKNHPGEIVSLGQGKQVELFSLEAYEKHCNQYFKKNRTKLKNLLSEDIPEGFINRQLNDSRYISSVIKGLLSNIVREEGEKEAVSKNLIPVTGSITSKLKQDWGLNDKWNELILPRFKRLNELTKSKDFTFFNEQGVEVPTVPDDISKGFNKKRIDHRHHALDALVIACCTKKHTHYLSSLNSEKENYGLRDALLIKNKENDYTKHFLLPWKVFSMGAKDSLDKIIVSFKSNTRVINKTNNKTWQWVEENGKYVKKLVKQSKGENWAIRKSLHKDTVSGLVYINEGKTVQLAKALEIPSLIVDKRIKNVIETLDGKTLKEKKAYFKKNPIVINGGKITKINVFTKATATRKPLSEVSNKKILEKITDEGIQKILSNHLKNYTKDKGSFDYEKAFNQEGVEELNKNIKELNNGKNHNPIYKVRIYEAGSKFSVGYKGNKKDKYVEAAKGTNLFFAIYEDENDKRSYETVPLNIVIEHQKQTANFSKEKRTLIPVDNKKGRLVFSLSPNDLVYVPTDEEIENPNLVDFKTLTKEQVGRVYKMVSTTQNKLQCILYSVAFSIKNKFEFSALNKMERDIEGRMIKSSCWKLEVDRLGHVTNVIR